MSNTNAKPFLKWVGGKTQLLDEIRQYYPFKTRKIVKYIEPFIGGGAVLFDILNNISIKSNKRAVPSDSSFKAKYTPVVSWLNSIVLIEILSFSSISNV